MREFILIVTAVIIIALVAVVFVIMYINHNKKRTVSPTSRQLFITKSKKTKPKIIQKIIL